jgi:hypothetical protein
VERAQTRKALGAELLLTPTSGGMEYARPRREHAARRQRARAGPVRHRGQRAHPLDGQTQVLAGLLSDQEQMSAAKVPG